MATLHKPIMGAIVESKKLLVWKRGAWCPAMSQSLTCFNRCVLANRKFKNGPLDVLGKYTRINLWSDLTVNNVKKSTHPQKALSDQYEELGKFLN